MSGVIDKRSYKSQSGVLDAGVLDVGSYGCQE